MGDLLEKEAEKRGVDSRPNFKKNILVLRETLMADKMRNSYIMLDIKITDEDLHNYYNNHLEQFQLPENVRIQEILMADEVEAKKLAQKIRAGADFSKLADQHTLRPGLKGKGGILDSITLAKSEPLFNAVKNAKKGQIVGPVPFKDKFSVIKLLERRPMKQLTYEEVLPRLRAQAYQAKKESVFRNWVEARRQKDQAEVYADLFISKLFDKLAQMQAERPPGENKKIKGQFPMKIKVGPEGKIEKVEDEE
jgi:peptidyl-prolyl cis-trans isomerase C